MCRLALTSLLSRHLRFQVLGGDVELGVLVHGRPRFTFTAAAITAATQATAAITACGQAAEDEQGLWTKSAQIRVSGGPGSGITPLSFYPVFKASSGIY